MGAGVRDGSAQFLPFLSLQTEPCLVYIQLVFEWTRETTLKFQDITKGLSSVCMSHFDFFQNCKQTRCSCPVKLRHVDPKRPHRQDLCGRCKGKRLSCDSTFSFKYII
uniref:Uncharacterized protein n=1 Tax=Ovis aries TaxID=9940 RepID=A0AC11EQ30_SHEEP